jgi:hypothetical protein
MVNVYHTNSSGAKKNPIKRYLTLTGCHRSVNSRVGVPTAAVSSGNLVRNFPVAIAPYPSSGENAVSTPV